MTERLQHPHPTLPRKRERALSSSLSRGAGEGRGGGGAGKLGLCLAALLLAHPASADSLRTRSIKIVPVPVNTNAVADARINIDPGTTRIGDTVKICFSVSAPGYVTLWDLGTDHSVSRIFPNSMSNSAGPSEQIGDAGEHCAGKDGDAFRFQVGGPPGIEDIYVLWTATPDLQPKSADFPSADAFSAALKSLDTTADNQWVAKKSSFDVNDAGPPPPPPPPPAAPSALSDLGRHIFLFAAGSNVKDLSKSNQDAHMIRDSLQKAFGIPDDHLKVVEDVTKPQFQAGVAWLAQVTQPDDIAIVYYSGHGMQAPDHTGTTPDGIEEAFIPIEFNTPPPHYYEDLILNHELVHWTNQIPANRVFVLADSCHSGGMVRGIQLIPIGTKPKFYVPTPELMKEAEAVATKEANDPAAVAAHREKPKAMLFAASQRDQTAAELKDGSLFTLALSEVLEDGAKDASKEKVTLADVFVATKQLVEKVSQSKQSPSEAGQSDIADTVVIPPSNGYSP